MTTLGPLGHTVLLAKSFGPPTVTKDGRPWQKEIELDDPLKTLVQVSPHSVAVDLREIAIYSIP